MKLPRIVREHRRYFFPFFGAPCCEKMSRWLSIEAFFDFPHIALAHNPSQADLLIVIGRVSHKQAPVLQKVFYDMLTPSSILHLKGCTTYLIDYASLRNLDAMVSVDSTLDTCPILPEQIRQAMLHLGGHGGGAS